MKRSFELANRIWEIAYPVLTYYVALSIGTYIAQIFLGTSVEQYMTCKIIGSIIAIPVVFADYKKDLMLTGRYGMKNPITSVQIKQLLAIIGITLCLSVGLNNMISMSPLVQMSDEFQNASDAFYGSSFGVELLGSALITPLLEELLHRGVVFGRLRRKMTMWSAVLVSALVFAVLHFNMVQFIYAFLLGIVFALFVEKTGMLSSAVVAHIVANALAVIRTETGFLQSTVDGSASAWLISVGISLVGVGLLVIFMENRKRNNNE